MIKAIPTYYAGCKFRSRLEARWAAFFDLCCFTWDYEPIDFDGWCPDFSIVSCGKTVFAEVKPVELKFLEGVGLAGPKKHESYKKAENHYKQCWVLKLGMQPSPHADYFSIGTLMDPPKDEDRPGIWFDVNAGLLVEDSSTLWRVAGQRVQWKPQGRANLEAPAWS